jgi:hypothetical protein
MTDLDPARIGSGAADGASLLVEHLAGIERPDIIEVGTLRSEPANPTHHTAWAPHGSWVRVDFEAGTDVDEVDDAHTLATFREEGEATFGGGIRSSYMPERFDAYVACSVWEHLERPWVAMKTAAAVVKPGGLVYVQTHQTFPIHGYPSDYFRFSDKALRLLMEDAGLEVLLASYTYPCQIIPPREVTRWNPGAASYLNVEALARKPEE